MGSVCFSCSSRWPQPCLGPPLKVSVSGIPPWPLGSSAQTPLGLLPPGRGRGDAEVTLPQSPECLSQNNQPLNRAPSGWVSEGPWPLSLFTWGWGLLPAVNKAAFGMRELYPLVCFLKQVVWSSAVRSVTQVGWGLSAIVKKTRASGFSLLRHWVMLKTGGICTRTHSAGCWLVDKGHLWVSHRQGCTRPIEPPAPGA